jgi:hypothetical protein
MAPQLPAPSLHGFDMRPARSLSGRYVWMINRKTDCRLSRYENRKVLHLVGIAAKGQFGQHAQTLRLRRRSVSVWKACATSILVMTAKVLWRLAPERTSLRDQNSKSRGNYRQPLRP